MIGSSAELTCTHTLMSLMYGLIGRITASGDFFDGCCASVFDSAEF